MNVIQTTESSFHLKTFLKKIDIGPFNIQKYLAGDHFSEFHSERTEIATFIEYLLG